MPWWILTYTETGRGFMVDTPFPSENRANRHLETHYGGNGETHETTSWDRRIATREIRAELARMQNNAWGKNFKHGKAEGSTNR